MLWCGAVSLLLFCAVTLRFVLQLDSLSLPAYALVDTKGLTSTLGVLYRWWPCSRLPTSHPTNQPASQPINHQPNDVDEPTGRACNQQANQPANQPASQLTSQTANQPTTIQPTEDQPASQPSNQPNIRPSNQPANQPSQPTNRPINPPTSRPHFAAVHLLGPSAAFANTRLRETESTIGGTAQAPESWLVIWLVGC